MHGVVVDPDRVEEQAGCPIAAGFGEGFGQERDSNTFVVGEAVPTVDHLRQRIVDDVVYYGGQVGQSHSVVAVLIQVIDEVLTDDLSVEGLAGGEPVYLIRNAAPINHAAPDRFEDKAQGIVF